MHLRVRQKPREHLLGALRTITWIKIDKNKRAKASGKGKGGEGAARQRTVAIGRRKNVYATPSIDGF